MPTSSQALRQLRSFDTQVNQEPVQTLSTKAHSSVYSSQMGVATMYSEPDLLQIPMDNFRSCRPVLPSLFRDVEAGPGGDVIEMSEDMLMPSQAISATKQNQKGEGFVHKKPAIVVVPPTDCLAPSLSNRESSVKDLAKNISCHLLDNGNMDQSDFKTCHSYHENDEYMLIQQVETLNSNRLPAAGDGPHQRQGGDKHLDMVDGKDEFDVDSKLITTQPLPIDNIGFLQGSCGVLTLNTDTGRYEWALQDNSGRIGNPGGFKGKRQRLTVKAPQPPLPTIQWVSPNEKRYQEQQAMSKQGPPKSILDLSQRLGKGVNLTRLLHLSGKRFIMGHGKDAIKVPWGDQPGYELLPPLTTDMIKMNYAKISRLASSLASEVEIKSKEDVENKSQHIFVDAGSQDPYEHEVDKRVNQRDPVRISSRPTTAKTISLVLPAVEVQGKINQPVRNLQRSEVVKEVYCPSRTKSESCDTVFSSGNDSREGSKTDLHYDENASDCNSRYSNWETDLEDMMETDRKSLKVILPALDAEESEATIDEPQSMAHFSSWEPTRPTSTESRPTSRDPYKLRSDWLAHNTQTSTDKWDWSARKEAYPSRESSPEDICQTPMDPYRERGALRLTPKYSPGPVIPPTFNKDQIKYESSTPGERSTPRSALFTCLDRIVSFMHKPLAASGPNKLCFQSNVPGCTHAEILDCLKVACPRVRITSLQYIPIQLHDSEEVALAATKFRCMWLFNVDAESDPTELLRRGLLLRGRRMKIQRLDDVYMGEQQSFMQYFEMLHRGRSSGRNSNNNNNNKRYKGFKNKASNNVYRAAERKLVPVRLRALHNTQALLSEYRCSRSR